MIIAKTIEEVRQHVREARAKGKNIGFAPTMGALHEGHASLFNCAKESLGENGFVVASIFVNPTQFGPNEDFDAYPRTEEADLDICKHRGVDLAFLPSVEEMYPEGAKTTVKVAKLTSHLCGKSRPGHFDGVTTIVAKLFNIVTPDQAFFGEKDYQQVAVIAQMVKDLDMPIEIIPCPTVREDDGLALSSRNAYLLPDQREQATALCKSLAFACELAEIGDATCEILEAMNFLISNQAHAGEIDYIHIVDAETLEDLKYDEKPADHENPTRAIIAVKFGGCRLIDNAEIHPGSAANTEK